MANNYQGEENDMDLSDFLLVLLELAMHLFVIART